MHCVGTLSWSVMGLGQTAKPSRRDPEAQAASAVRPHQAQDGSDLVQARLQAGLAVLPSEEELSLGVPAAASAVHPSRGEAVSLEIDWSQIVRRCMDGDSSAWAELVRAQHRRVYGLCYRFTGNPADAEDLTQDVFLKIYSNLASFDTNRGSLQVWITTMTRNLLVDNFRRTRNQRATGSLDDG